MHNSMDEENSQLNFPTKVAQVFMLDDGFFSPIMRNKIPQMLFTNGSSGLDRMFPLSRPASTQPFRSFPFEERSESPGSVVRHVPIRVKPTLNDSHGSQNLHDSRSFGSQNWNGSFKGSQNLNVNDRNFKGSQNLNDRNFKGSQNLNDRNFKDSQNLNGSQNFNNSRSSEDSDSSGTLRRMESPIYDSRRPSNLYSDRSSLAPSLSRRSTPSPHPPQNDRLSRSATPTDQSAYSPTSHRLPSYYPHRQNQKPLTNSNNNSFDSLPPRNDRIYERQQYTARPRPYQSTPTNEPPPQSVSFLRRTQTQNDVLDGDQKHNTNHTSPPLSRRESEPAIQIEDEELGDTSTLPPRPNSRLSARSKAKSPSLNSLRQGLKKANFIAQCMTKPNKNERNDLKLQVDNDDSTYKPTKETKEVKEIKEQLSPNYRPNTKTKEQLSPNKNRSSFLSFWQKPSRTQSTPSLIEPKPLSLRRPSENDLALDPVEEAIKSLENFDPNEYIKATQSNAPKSPNSNNNNGKPFNNRSQSIEKLAPSSQHNSYGSVNPLPYTTSLPPIPTIDYNTDSPPRMGNQNSNVNRQKPPTPNILQQREPQKVTFQAPSTTNSRTEADSRRRTLRQQMTDNAKSIELHAVKLGKMTSNPNWRQSKQLEQNLPTVEKIVNEVDNSLYDLLDATARVSLQRSDPAYQDLQLLINPLRNSQSLIRRLRTALNLTNWSVSLLSKQSPNENNNDSLDQFVAILKHLPNDCSKLVHWIYNQDRANMVSFLPAGVATAPPPNVRQQDYSNHDYYQSSRDQHRQQNGAPPIYSTNNRNKPFPNQPQKHPTLPHWQGETVDGGESTTSSNDSSPINRSTDDDDSTPKHSIAPRHRDEDSIDEEMIMEEDDLASVISDHQSPTWQNGPTKLRHDSGEGKRRQLHIDILKNLNDEEYEFLKFCGPQINQHVDVLTQVIEEFFNTIENGQHPTKFSQKLRLISMESMTLTHLASNVGKHMSQPLIRAEFKHAADSLDSLTLECEHKLEVAKKQHPSVGAIQALVSAVVSLSKQAQNLKLIARTCQLAANDSR